MKLAYKVEGLRELGNAMRELGQREALKIAGAMTNAGAQVVKKEAVLNIEKSPSIDEGDLRDAVIVKKRGRSESRLTSEHIVTVRGRGKETKKSVQFGAPHAHLVEFGTVNMPAEPFLRPALDQNIQKAIDAMKAKGDGRVEAAARKLAKGRK